MIKMFRKYFFYFLAGALLSFFTGCAQLAALRGEDGSSSAYDNNAPTTGGRWAERGLLSDDHMERSPAQSASSGPYDHWVDPSKEAQGRSDDGAGDGQPSFSSNPNYLPQTKRLYKNGSRATRADFTDDATNEGSLWGSDGQTNYYFTKNKIRGVGDIVSVVIDAAMIKDLGQEVKRTLTDNERYIELDLAQQRAVSKSVGATPTAPGAAAPAATGTDSVATTQAAPAPAAANTPSGGILGPVVSDGDIDVSKSLDVKSGDTVMCEIAQRYPNGNYKIRGTKKLIYKNGAARLVNLTAVVKGSDISDDDSVTSGKLYEYRLEAIR